MEKYCRLFKKSIIDRLVIIDYRVKNRSLIIKKVDYRKSDMVN